MLILQVIDTISNGPDGVIMQEKINLIDLTLKGGPIMIPIAILSIVAVYMFVYKYLMIRKAANLKPEFMDNIKDYLANNNIEAAKSLCKHTDSPVAKAIEKGLLKLDKPLKNIESAIENTAKVEIHKLERGLSVLATISGAAPMLGFLGTVTGMINAFFNMSTAGNNITPSLLAGGIYEALVTTAAGLFVGVPAYIAYNYLLTQIDKVVHKIEVGGNEFIELIQDKQ